MSFNQKVNRLLKENKMTKATLAKESGIPYTTLDSMLKRETDTKRLAIFFRIAKTLGTSVESLVFDNEDGDTPAEAKKVLELYSLLDSRGRNTVLSLLEKEADNSLSDQRRSIPVYEAPAAAGTGIEILTEETQEAPVQEDTPAGDGIFAIRIAGDSMEPLIGNGDLVYVEKCEELRNGEIGIFVLNGESLCKKYSVKEDGTYLVSLNPNYKPIHVLESDRLFLVGRVILSRP